jgi:drug/metabolite transporter (DMT)-like permease
LLLTPTTSSSSARRDIAALVLAAACWGLGTVISKAALGEFPPATLLAVQLASSLAVLTLLMRRQGIPLRGGGPPLLGRLGLLNPGVAYALGLLGLTTITASVSVLLWALEPLLILLLAVAFLRERITPRLILLSAVAITGIVLVVYEPTGMSGQAVGVALTVAGIACCAAYTVVTRRFLPGAQETSQVVLSQQAYGFGLASAVLSGVLYYAGAYWLYLGALRRVPASLAAASFYLIPIVGVAGGALVLDERLGAVQWIGAVLVLIAVTAILTRSSSAAAPIAVQPTQGSA